MSKIDVFLYLHTHWDREWYRSFEDFRIRLIDVFSNVLEDLNLNKINSFYFDGQTVALEDFLEIYPEKMAEVKKLIEQNKLFIGPWYALADEFLVSGESLLRNLLIGISYSKQLGMTDFIGYLPDAFGHVDDMPRIFNSVGIDKSVVWRGSGKNKTEFVWQSKDSSKILATHLIEGYFMDVFSMKTSVEKKAEILKKILDKISKYKVSNKILLPVGADHLGVMQDIASQIEEISKYLKNYNLKLSSLDEYFKNIQKPPKLEVVQGELRDNSRNFILPGCFSTRTYLKQQNADVTWLLSKVVEPFQSALEFYGVVKPRKNELEYAWKMLFKNHAHDDICGCSIDPVHREMVMRNEKIAQVANSVLDSACYVLRNRLSENEIAVFNSSSYDYSGIIKLVTDKKLPEALIVQKISEQKAFPKEIVGDVNNIPVQEHFTKFSEYLIMAENVSSVALQGLKSCELKDKIKDSDLSLENNSICLKVNKDGRLSLKNKLNGLEFKGLLEFEDVADDGDTYNFVPLKSDEPVKATFKSSKLIVSGELMSKLRLNFEMKIPEKFVKNKRSKRCLMHKFFTDILIYNNSDRIEFETFFENKSLNHLLRVKFKLNNPVAETVSEDNFGLITRKFDPNYRLEKQQDAPVGVELKTNTACMQRFVWAQGFGVLTKGLQEYEIKGNELCVTLLRTIGILSKAGILTRGTAAGPPLPVDEAQCLGKQVFKYAISLTSNPQELFKHADFYFGSIVAMQGVAEKSLAFEFSPLVIDNKNIYLYALKQPVSGKKRLVARLYNLSSETQKVVLKGDFKNVLEVNVLEEPLKHLKDKTIIFKPNELKTFIFT